jgi:Uma2 family endonuclease
MTTYIDFVPDAVVFSISKRRDAKVWSKVYLFPSVDIELLSTKDQTQPVAKSI